MRKFKHSILKHTLAFMMAVAVAVSGIPASAAEPEDASDVGTIQLGTASTELKTETEYLVPVALKNASDTSSDSAAKACLGKYGVIFVDENGMVTFQTSLQSVTIGTLTDYASDFKIYQGASTGADLEDATAESYETVSSVNGSGTKEVPTKISFTIPEAAKKIDGVYINMYVEAMNNSPNAFIQIDYANAVEIGSKIEKSGSAQVDQFGKYTVTATVTLTATEDGLKISGVEVEGSEFSGTYAENNQLYLSKAVNGMKDLFTGLSDTDADKVQAVDAVTGATKSSNAIRSAVMDALGMEETEEILPDAPTSIAPGTYKVQISDRTDVVDHSLVETDKTEAVLRVDSDGGMTLSYQMVSGTRKEPLYILGYNGYYQNENKSKLIETGVVYNTAICDDYTVVTNVQIPLSDISQQYYHNVYLYVPAMENLNGEVSGVVFDNGKFNIDSTITVYWDTLETMLEDGVYAVSAQMLKPDGSVSMSDNAIVKTVKLTVQNGTYTLTLNFKGMTISSLKGYLSDLKYYQSGYAKNKNQYPSGTLSDVTVESYQKYTNGTVVKDDFGTNYPDIVSFEMIPESLIDGCVPLQVFVPIMEALSEGSGTQDVYLTLDMEGIRKTTDNDSAFDDTELIEAPNDTSSETTTPSTTTPSTTAPSTTTPSNSSGSAQTVTVSAPGSVKAASAAYNKVKVSWSKVSGADGYEVYQYNSKTKSYSKIADVKTASYTKSGLTAGTKYTFKVRAYKNSGGTKVYSSYTKTVSAKPVPAKVTKVKVKNSAKKAALVSWKKVSGASGYQIVRATKKNGKYKAVATVKKAGTVKYTNKKLTKGKTYYFKVRAYRTVGKKKVYGAYSAVVSVKIKK